MGVELAHCVIQTRKREEEKKKKEREKAPVNKNNHFSPDSPAFLHSPHPGMPGHLFFSPILEQR
jgi:hypothetical protein